MPNGSCLLNAIINMFPRTTNINELLDVATRIITQDPRLRHARELSKYLPVVIANVDNWQADIVKGLQGKDVSAPIIVVLRYKTYAHACIFTTKQTARYHDFHLFKTKVI